MLKNINMKECQLVGSPFDVNSSLLKYLDEELQNVHDKQIACKVNIGSYMYAMMDIRVDLTLAVNTVTQFMLKVGSIHWMVVEHQRIFEHYGLQIMNQMQIYCFAMNLECQLCGRHTTKSAN